MALTLPTFRWTLTGNYPAGANLWNNQPLAVKPAGTYVTPNTKPSGENLNWIWGTEAQDVLNLFAEVASMQALNWQDLVVMPGNNYFQAPNTIDSLMAACWAPLAQKWYFVCQGHSSTPHNLFQAFATIDGVNYTNFTQSLALGLYPQPVANLAQDQYFVAIGEDTATAGKMYVAWQDAGSIGTVSVWSFQTSWTQLPNIAIGASTCRVNYHNFNNHLLLGIGTAVSAQATIIRDVPYVTAMSGGSALAIRFADNSGNGGPGNMCVAMNCLGTSPGHYWTSPDGITWTSQNFALVGGGTIPNLATMYAFDVCWTQDAQGPCWLLGFQNGAQPVFYRSTDGINWSLQSQPTLFSGALSSCVTMAACGSLVVISGSDGYSGAYSTDGGVTWYKSPTATFTPSTAYNNGNLPTTSFYMANSIFSNGSQFCLANSTGTKFSLAAGLGQSIN